MGVLVEPGRSPFEEVAPAGVADSADIAILRSAAAAICSRRAALLSESWEAASDIISTSSPAGAATCGRSGWRGGGDRRLGSSWSWALMTKVSSSGCSRGWSEAALCPAGRLLIWAILWRSSLCWAGVLDGLDMAMVWFAGGVGV